MTTTPALSLIGAPTDVGAGSLGSSMGPAALRVAGLGEGLARLGCALRDCGDLAGPANPGEAARDGVRHLAEVSAWCRSVYDAVLTQLVAGRIPIMLGGDHCLAIGSISAVAQHCRETKKRLKILWFDAHTDFNTASLTLSGNLHGMPVACLCGHGPAELTRLSGHMAAIRPDMITQIGIRSVDPGEKRFVHDMGIEIFDMRRIDELGMPAIMQQVLSQLDENTHLHVSLDVDFLDPDIAPGVATTVRGGPTYREAQLCMEMIADTGLLASLDLVELNPAFDVRNQTALLIVDLVESLFGKSTLLRD